LVYFGIIIAVLACPVKDLAPLPREKTEVSFANIDDNAECADEGEGNVVD
jgi:hypothetical protein